jgi:hypothetical protein
MAACTTSASAEPTPEPASCYSFNLHIRVVAAATGELLCDLTLDPIRDYQPTGRPRRPKGNSPNPQYGPGHSHVLRDRRAVAVGFEPTVAVNHTRFRVVSPMCQSRPEGTSLLTCSKLIRAAESLAFPPVATTPKINRVKRRPARYGWL